MVGAWVSVYLTDAFLFISYIHIATPLRIFPFLFDLKGSQILV